MARNAKTFVQMTKPAALLIGEMSERMLGQLGAHFELHRPEDVLRFLGENGAEVSYVLCNGHGGVSAEMIGLMPALKVISNYGVGYDAIATPTAVERGIIVTHTPNVLNEEVATTALMLMMACYRNLLVDDAYVRAGRWPAEGNAPLSRTMDGRRVGILGMGRIGEAIARKLQAFTDDISYHTRSEKDLPYRYFADLTAMAREVEVLICITPGGADTRHLVNAEVLKALGSEGMLINVARGSVVDETALVAALQAGELGWAGLDVFEDEPNVPELLFAMKNVVLLPHVGSATEETRIAMGDLACANLISFHTDGKSVAVVPECAHLSA